ncbi:hypothetical protein EON67_02070 [archaeon]|nr:MAG: hypothetical protein EON67_02070 [archaeon]
MVQRIHLMPNPCTFLIDGITFGVSSTDVLFALSKNEATRLHGDMPGSGPKVDRLTRLMYHMLEQRSFFPPIPPCDMDAPGSAVPLEYTQLWSMDMPVTPQVLIAPSKMKSFVRGVSDDCVLINPGPLVKGSSGGTYARCDINPANPGHITTCMCRARALSSCRSGPPRTCFLFTYPSPSVSTRHLPCR